MNARYIHNFLHHIFFFLFRCQDHYGKVVATLREVKAKAQKVVQKFIKDLVV
jgi:hypothetical protein